MLRNYIKLAFRNIQNHTSYSFINLSGLSIGLAAAIVISLYAIGILTYDNYHKEKDRIFLAYKERITPDGIQATYDTWIPLARRLKTEYVGVRESAMHYTADGMVKQNEDYINETITYSEASIFDIFHFDFGQQKGQFDGLYSVIISSSIAEKYFNDQDPTGMEMEIFLSEEDTIMRYVVSSVFRDLPENSSVQPSIIIPFRSIPGFRRFETNWGSSFINTWVLLDEKIRKDQLEEDFPDLIKNIWDKETQARTNFKLLPLDDYYDTLVGDEQDAWVMLSIAIGILIIASINFMNLSTARSTYRSREIGLRKVLGAFIAQIRIQFLIEAVIYAFISLGIGLTIVFFTLPYLNDFFDLHLHFNTLFTSEGLLSLVAITITIGLLSGSYPAFYLSTVSIIQVLRKTGLAGGARSFRNALIVVQFGLAVLLICGSLLVRNQLRFMYGSDMGFSSEQLLLVNASPSDFTNRELGATRINSFKKNISNYAFVEKISASRNVPTDWSRSFVFVRPAGWTGDPLRMRYTYMDAGFFPTYEIGFTSGRNFLPDREGHQRSSVIINEAAYNALNLDTVQFPAIRIGQNEIEVVGVVNDFNYETLRNEIAPTLHFHRTIDHAVHQYVTVKINSADLPHVIRSLEAEWEKLGAIEPFRYAFADESVERMYESEVQFLTLISFFTFISIFIACLGLYGLTVFVIEKKRKEISIRKVVGANLKDITSLVVKEFAPWVVLALITGGFISTVFFNEWIENFHYQAPMNYLTFVTTGIIVLVLVTVTVGFHTVQAAAANPVKYLRED